MNCAKCATPPPRSGKNFADNYAPLIRLVKIEGGDADHEKFKCPRCQAEFFFRK